MEYTEKQMEKLVEDVRNQLSQLLKGEDEEKKVLAKSEPSAPEPQKIETKPLEKKEESSSEAKKAEESSSALEKSGPAPAPHKRPASDKGNPMKAEDSATETATEESSPAKKAEESSSSMEKAYREMSKSERETHYKALKRFIWEDQGFEIRKAEESSKACKAEESSSSTAKKAEESTSSTSPAEKAESISKAEQDLAVLKTENDTLKKNVEQLIASLNRVIVKAPDRKSVAGISEIVKKPGEGTDDVPLTEPVLRSQLNSLTKSEKLSKAERETINDYVLAGKGREKVLTLVKDKAK